MDLEKLDKGSSTNEKYILCCVEGCAKDSGPKRFLSGFVPIITFIKLPTNANVCDLYSEVSKRFSYTLDTFFLKFEQTFKEFTDLNDYYGVMLEEVGFSFSKSTLNVNYLFAHPQEEEITIKDLSKKRFKDFFPVEVTFMELLPMVKNFYIHCDDVTHGMLDAFVKKRLQVSESMDLIFEFFGMSVCFSDYLDELLNVKFKKESDMVKDLDINRIQIGKLKFPTNKPLILDRLNRKKDEGYTKGTGVTYPRLFQENSRFRSKITQKAIETQWLKCYVLNSLLQPSSEKACPVFALFTISLGATAKDIFTQVAESFSYALDSFELSSKQESSELPLSDFYDVPLEDLGFSEDAYLTLLSRNGDKCQTLESEKKFEEEFFHCECLMARDPLKTASFYVHKNSTFSMLKNLLEKEYKFPSELLPLFYNDKLKKKYYFSNDSLLHQAEFLRGQKNLLVLYELEDNSRLHIKAPFFKGCDYCFFIRNNSIFQKENLFFVAHFSALASLTALRNEISEFFECDDSEVKLFQVIDPRDPKWLEITFLPVSCRRMFHS